MQKIVVNLQLDSPLLMGGASNDLETSGVIRGPSLRGLLHSFGRAFLGYMCGSSTDQLKLVRILEETLLGAAGDSKGPGNTFRIANREAKLKRSASYPTVPKHSGKEHRTGAVKGFEPGQNSQIELTVPRRSLDANPHFFAALESIVWLSLSLGSVGKRSRRGYGSLSIQSMRFTEIGCEPQGTDFPVFDRLFDDGDLAGRLKNGIGLATDRMRAWIQDEMTHNPRLAKLTGELTPQNSPVDKFYQFGGLGQVFVGTPEADYLQVMKHFNKVCHDLSSDDDHRRIYQDFIGNANPRLASPVWLRVFQVAENRFVGVITFSPTQNDQANSIAQLMAASINGTSISARLP